MNRKLLLATLLPFAALLQCDRDTPQAPGTGLALEVAPLTLVGVTNATWRVEVDNAAGDPVIALELDARRYGDGRGSLSYVAPCDASSNPNTVTLTLLGLFEGAAGTTPIDPDTWRNPGPLPRQVTCVENADVLVEFDVTIARDADQGFFDVAVTFEDIFCSAKLDCTTNLLLDGDGVRRPTVVVAFACTSGETTSTVLYHDPIDLTCASGAVVIDPSAGPGTLAYGDGISGTPGLLFGAAVYRGSEDLGVSKGYWNVALGLEGAPSSCVLTSAATASDGPLLGSTTPADAVYPYVQWSVELTDETGALVCTTHPLDGEPPNDGVATAYTTGGPRTFASVFAVEAGVDLCPEDPAKLAPGVCGCGVADTNADGDGAADCNDGCVNDPAKLAPGVCGCGVADTDTDGDLTADCVDGCVSDPGKTASGVCGCGVADTDTDGDLTADCNDGCVNDPAKIAPGVCGCGVADTDADGDLTADCEDGCVNDASKVAPGICGCGVADTDTDGDLTADCEDGCVSDPAKIAPGVCGCGVADVDSDGDLTADCQDGCPADGAKTAPGQCGCGAADTDGDGDGAADCVDGCDADPDKTAPGTCGCDVPDDDLDGDGVLGCLESCPLDPDKTAPGTCGCGVPEGSCLPTAELVTVSSLSSASWTQVNLSNAYASMVVVCTPQYGASSAPAPVRVRNATSGSTFEVQVAEAGGGPVSGVTARCLVVEEGVYTAAGHGIQLEARKFVSTTVAWGGQPTSPFLSRAATARTYAQSYTHPVVLGQVMSANDPSFSVFFAHGETLVQPASRTALWVGKHVSRDSDLTRADETVGYVVLEAGTGTFAAQSYVAGLGPRTVAGFADAPPYNYGFAGLATVTNAIATFGSGYGSDGHWPILYGAGALGVNTLGLAVDEHVSGTRSHALEHVPYLVFGDCGSGDADNDGAPDCADDCPADPTKTALGVCGCGVTESLANGDGDAYADCVDGCPSDATKNQPGECGCGVADTDSDADGYADCADSCPSDATKSAPGVCGCGVAETDGDNDGAPDCTDGCPTDPLKTSPGVCGCNKTEDSCVIKAEVQNPTVSSTAWSTVTLSKTYVDPVVVCTPAYGSGSQPGVAWVRNAGSTSFQVTIGQAGGTALSNVPVRCLVVEAGVYTVATHGLKLEAVKYTSTVTDNTGSWVGQARTYSNTYTSPVVLGQVMSANSAKYSVFWARGATAADPPTASAFYAGKHTSRDTSARSNETVGYIVFEAGTGTLGGYKLTAALGANTVGGYGTAPPYAYTVSGYSSVATAVLSSAGMNGGDGGWPIFYGSNPVTTTTLNMAVDEDFASTDGRSHTTEEIAYIVLGQP